MIFSYSITGDYVCNIQENFFDAHPSNDHTDDVSNWEHTEGEAPTGTIVADEDGPVVVYNKLVNEIGEADVVANQPGGIAIWYIDNKDGIHHSIELRDEYVPHCVPAQHYDFLISYIRVYVPPEKLNDVITVSGSVGYDGLKHLLSARCASLEANMATLTTCLKVMNNENQSYGDNIKKDIFV